MISGKLGIIIDRVKLIGLLVLCLLVGSCTELKRTISRTPRPSAEDCLKRAIARDIDSNSILSEIPILVNSVSNGDIEMHVPASNRGPISDGAMLRIRKGDNLQRIQRDDGTITFLLDFERKLKQRKGVRSVKWTADEPCAPGFVCQTTGSSERSADEEEIEAQCNELDTKS